MSTLRAQVVFSFAAFLRRTLGSGTTLGTHAARVYRAIVADFPNGNGSGQANMLLAQELTLVANVAQTIDLRAFDDPMGDPQVMGACKGLMIEVVSGGPVTVTGSYNPFGSGTVAIGPLTAGDVVGMIRASGSSSVGVGNRTLVFTSEAGAVVRVVAVGNETVA